MLNTVLKEIEEALGEYAPATEDNCPEWALSLKEAEIKIIEAIEELDLGVENVQLKKLWQEFNAWDSGANCGVNDDEAERYARHKGAHDHQAIAFMAFVEGRSISEVEE
jgi:hypothetical protein